MVPEAQIHTIASTEPATEQSAPRQTDGMHGGGRIGVELTWAKSSPHGVPADHWLPLHQHLTDTADIAGLLWDEWLAPSVRATISSALPDGQDDGRRLLVWLAGVHDVGKATPAFAVQSKNLCDRMQTAAGMTVGPFVLQDRGALRHETAGAAALDAWIAARSPLPERRRRQLTCVVAGHHGTYGDVGPVKQVTPDSALYGAGEWARVREAMLDRAAERVGIGDRIGSWSEVRLPRTAQMLLTAAVVMSDWIASDERY